MTTLGREPARDLGDACREAMALSPIDTPRKVRRFAELMEAMTKEPGSDNDLVWRYATMNGIALLTIGKLVEVLDRRPA